MELQHIECDLGNRAMITATSLQFALCKFITEVKKIDDSDFPGKTPHDIVICLQFHLGCLGFCFKLINEKIFSDIKYTLDNTIKLVVTSGIGFSVRQVEVLTAMDGDYLWSLGFLGTGSLEQLLNTVVFCVGKGFALWAGREHRALQVILFNL